MPPSQKSHRPGRVAVRLASLTILLVLGIQAFVGVVLPPIYWRIKQSWPFVNYPMYSKSYEEGQHVRKLAVIAVFEDGTELLVTAEDLKLRRWLYDVFANSILREEADIAAEFMLRHPRGADGSCRMLRVIDCGSIFTLEGLRPAPWVELAELEVREEDLD